MSQFSNYSANDGETLAYQTHGQPSNAILILIHGFTGSSQYFSKNFETLSRQYYIVAPDLRGHGNSSKARHGYHVCRLAADLKDLIVHVRGNLPEASFVGVGCSLGAAVLWTYAELFSAKDFAGMVFVDQAPLQDYIPGSVSQYNGHNQDIFRSNDSDLGLLSRETTESTMQLPWLQPKLRCTTHPTNSIEDSYKGVSHIGINRQNGTRPPFQLSSRRATRTFSSLLADKAMHGGSPNCLPITRVMIIETRFKI
jgi:pimeloyl-ACP methyl ester carboxylesterase